mmetsp:Transcript_13304/g.30322  ORF Transcript_13304/g.30322 Transcript_13304/m.30322 type:complete len:246 (-) Transcript_13304:236-973(-)
MGCPRLPFVATHIWWPEGNLHILLSQEGTIFSLADSHLAPRLVFDPLAIDEKHCTKILPQSAYQHDLVSPSGFLFPSAPHKLGVCCRSGVDHSVRELNAGGHSIRQHFANGLFHGGKVGILNTQSPGYFPGDGAANDTLPLKVLYNLLHSGLESRSVLPWIAIQGVWDKKQLVHETPILSSDWSCYNNTCSQFNSKRFASWQVLWGTQYGGCITYRRASRFVKCRSASRFAPSCTSASPPTNASW